MIVVKAPTRIDLAGGTLDLWPLSSIFAPGVCINLAVDLYATATAEKTPGTTGLAVNAVHFGKRYQCKTGAPEKQKTLFHRVLDQLPIDGWSFTVDCKAPPGSGLGGSSALVVALIKTHLKIRGERMDNLAIIDMAKNIEARHLGIPTGIQDYVAALNGGVSRITAGEGGMTASKVKIDNDELAKRLLLVYSGASRISGTANWEMFKRAIDGDKTTVGVFRSIAANSLKVEKALLAGDFDTAARLSEKENGLREKLGEAVIPSDLKKAFSAVKQAGGKPKICGAGGGGCFVVWCKPSKRKAVEDTIAGLGMTLLPFKPGKPIRSSG